MCFPFGDSRKFIFRECFRRPPNRKQIISRYEQDANGWEMHGNEKPSEKVCKPFFF